MPNSKAIVKINGKNSGHYLPNSYCTVNGTCVGDRVRLAHPFGSPPPTLYHDQLLVFSPMNSRVPVRWPRGFRA